MKRPGSLVLIISFVLAMCSLAFAHSGATGIVKERMDLMKSIADQMKTIGRMIKGEDDYDADQASNAARTILAHAEKFPEMFPEGTAGAPSEALPAIWQDWETFLQISADLKRHANDLSAAAETASDVDAIRPHFVAVGKTCSACHEDFRATR